MDNYFNPLSYLSTKFWIWEHAFEVTFCQIKNIYWPKGIYVCRHHLLWLNESCYKVNGQERDKLDFNSEDVTARWVCKFVFSQITICRTYKWNVPPWKFLRFLLRYSQKVTAGLGLQNHQLAISRRKFFLKVDLVSTRPFVQICSSGRWLEELRWNERMKKQRVKRESKRKERPGA